MWPRNTEEHMLTRITVDANGCWLWEGSTCKHGYGRVQIDGKSLQAHRVMYEYRVGPIPAGFELDHGCRVHRCINPAHMEPVTHMVNVLRGVSLMAMNAAKVVCLNGHALEGGKFVRHGCWQPAVQAVQA